MGGWQRTSRRGRLSGDGRLVEGTVGEIRLASHPTSNTDEGRKNGSNRKKDTGAQGGYFRCENHRAIYNRPEGRGVCPKQCRTAQANGRDKRYERSYRCNLE